MNSIHILDYTLSGATSSSNHDNRVINSSKDCFRHFMNPIQLWFSPYLIVSHPKIKEWAPRMRISTCSSRQGSKSMKGIMSRASRSRLGLLERMSSAGLSYSLIQKNPMLFIRLRRRLRTLVCASIMDEITQLWLALDYAAWVCEHTAVSVWSTILTQAQMWPRKLPWG